jgi:acetylornithine deacetylase/succinyl-diaminopimelate desuccinylase-like protein
VRTRATILFVGTVGEEGTGNLRGVRHLFESELKGRRVASFLSVDGTGLGLTKDAVGSYRYRVAYVGPGGHSYGDFGAPNPVHALGRAIASIADLQVPSEPRVTFSVGVIEGGTSVNSIATRATMQVDMRSVDPRALDELDGRFRAAVQAALAAENARWPAGDRLTVEVERWGLRPAGTQPADAPVVRAAEQAGRALGFEPRAIASSTDANIPIALGIPSLTLDAGGEGRGAHSPEESWDSRNSELGTQWVLLVTAALAGVR